jgi:hypothetical protein
MAAKILRQINLQRNNACRHVNFLNRCGVLYSKKPRSPNLQTGKKDFIYQEMGQNRKIGKWSSGKWQTIEWSGIIVPYSGQRKFGEKRLACTVTAENMIFRSMPRQGAAE